MANYDNSRILCITPTGDLKPADVLSDFGNTLCDFGPTYDDPQFDPGTVDYGNADVFPRSLFNLRPGSTMKPFRGRYGFDAALNRGVNFDRPAQDFDAANRIFVEEQVAAQSRLKGTYQPDSDGQQNPSPDLDALIPNVDVLTADYYVTETSGRANSGPMALIDLNADDRIVANVSDNSVQTFTLNPVTPTGLIPNTTYRFDPADPAYAGKGRSLGLLLFTDGTGTVNATGLANNGHGYRVGDVLNATIPNAFVNAIETLGAPTPAAFQLLPDTTYYNALITGGTGAGAVVNFRTDATGAAISDTYLIARGAGYTVADTLTVEIQGQTIGTWPVATVFNGTDVACQVTVTTVGTDVGWDLIRGAGLTRAQADRDYLRLDGGTRPTRDIYWNQQRIKDLADPLDQQDAVNLRTLNSSSVRLYITANAIGHAFATGDLVSWDAVAGTWGYAQADTEAGLAVGVVEVQDADNFLVVTQGILNWAAHGFTLGAQLYLDALNLNTLTETRPTSGYIQPIARVRNANALAVINQAVVYTGF